MSEDRYMVIDQNNHIYYNEFGSDEEIMDLDSAKWLAYKLSAGCKEDRLVLKVMKLVEIVE